MIPESRAGSDPLPSGVSSAPTGRLARWFEIGEGGARSRVLEGVRGLAVALVFLVHFDATFSRFLLPGSLARTVSNWASRIGYHGVDIFFVLSGFLIYRGVVGRRVSYATFFARRVRRIYPTFLAVFALYVALSFVVPSYSKLPPEGRATYLVENLLLLPGVFKIQPLITVSWSLSYEIFFYLSLPLIVGLLQMHRWRPGARMAFFAAIPVSLFLIGPITPFTLSRFMIFLPGMMLADLAVGWRDRPKSPARLEWLLLPLIVALGIAGVWIEAIPLARLPHFWAADQLRGSNTAIRQTVLIGGAAALLIGIGLRVDGTIGRFFMWRPLRYLGNMSYSYYLFHGLTLNAIKFMCDRLLPTDYVSVPMVVVALPLSFGVTVVTSTVLFLVIEKPFSWKS